MARLAQEKGSARGNGNGSCGVVVGDREGPDGAAEQESRKKMEQERRRREGRVVVEEMGRAGRARKHPALGVGQSGVGLKAW